MHIFNDILIILITVFISSIIVSAFIWRDVVKRGEKHNLFSVFFGVFCTLLFFTLLALISSYESKKIFDFLWDIIKFIFKQ